MIPVVSPYSTLDMEHIDKTYLWKLSKKKKKKKSIRASDYMLVDSRHTHMI